MRTEIFPVESCNAGATFILSRPLIRSRVPTCRRGSMRPGFGRHVPDLLSPTIFSPADNENLMLFSPDVKNKQMV